MKRTLLFLLVILFTSGVVISQDLDEGFEGSFPPNDWTNTNWSQSTYGGPHTGSEYAYSNLDGATLTTLQVNASSSKNLKFWYRCESSSYPQDLDVMVGDDIIFQVIDYASTTYIQADISLAAYDGLTIRIKFVGRTGTGGWDYGIDIDDVTGPEIFVPSCPAPTAQTETNITATSADLGWTTGGSSTWNIEYGPTGFTQGSGIMITGITSNPYNLSGLSSGTTYDWYVQDDCGGDQSTWIGPSTFTTLQTPAPVQSLPFTENWETNLIGSAWNYDAGSVSTIQTSTASVHGGTYGLEQYGNDASFTTPSSLADAYTKAQPGGTNENWTTWNKLSVDLSGTSSPWLSFWYAMGYQYNNNYNNFWVQVSTDGTTWTDLFSTQTNGAAIAYEYKEFDLSAYNGTAQLYIRFFHSGKYNTNYLYLDDILVAEVTCPSPQNLDISSFTATTADLIWDQLSGSSGYNWEVVSKDSLPETGNAIDSGHSTPGIDTTATALGLTANTTYDAYVQNDCGSTWTGPSTFTTACNSFSVPFNEGFNSSSTTQGCWIVINENGDGDEWNMDYTINPYEGDQVAVMYTDYNAGANDDYLVSPTITLTGNQQLKYWYRVQSSSEPNDFEVLVSTTGTDPSDFTDIILPNTTYSNTTYEEKTIDLSSFSGNVNIAWHVAPGGLDGWRIYVDNVTIEDIPSCPPPSDLAVTEETSSSARLSWIAGSGVPGYNWQVVPEGNDPDGEPLAGGTVFDTTVVANGLDAATSYDAYVRSDCSGGARANGWIGPVTFTTACNTVTTFPLSEGFENGGNIPICWSTEFVIGTQDWAFSDGGHSHHPDHAAKGSYNALFYHASSYSPATTRLVSPSLDLSGAISPYLTFLHAQPKWASDQDELRVYYKTSKNGAWTLIPGAEWTEDIPDWKGEIITLPNPSADYYIAFEAIGQFGHGVSIDQVQMGPVAPVPVSDWAIVIGVFFILTFLVVTYRRRFA